MGFPDHSVSGTPVTIVEYTDDFFGMMEAVRDAVTVWDWGGYTDKDGLIQCLRKVEELALKNNVIHEYKYKNYRFEYDNGQRGGQNSYRLMLRIEAWEFTDDEVSHWGDDTRTVNINTDSGSNCLYSDYVYEQVTLPRVQYWNDFHTCSYEVVYNLDTQHWDVLDFPESWSTSESDNDKRYFYSLNGRVRNEYYAATLVDMYWSGLSFSFTPGPGPGPGPTPVPEGWPGNAGSTSGLYPSTVRGGDGTFDDSTDSVSLPDQLDIDISDIGFFSVWCPTQAQMKNISRILWTNPLPIQKGQTLEDIMNNFVDMLYNKNFRPVDSIVSLSMFPIDFSEVSTPSNFVLGGIVYNGGTLTPQVTVNKLALQFYDFDFGDIKIDRYWGAALDYSPYTACQIFLPYIGWQDIDLNDVMGSTVNLRYRIDIVTGQVLASLHVKKDGSGSDGSGPIDCVMYEWPGMIKYEIPITSGGNSVLIDAMTKVITSGVTAGVGTAVAHLQSEADYADELYTRYENNRDVGPLRRQDAENAHKKLKTATGAQNILKGINSGGSGVGSPGISHGGVGSGLTGMMGVQEAFLMIHRPIQSIPDNYKHYFGYPVNATFKIGDLSGFVKVRSIHLDDVVSDSGAFATPNEVSILENLLTGGVIL